MIERTTKINGKIVSRMIEGGCDKCGKFCSSGIDGVANEDLTILTCADCWEKHYSPQAIRRKKLERVLYVPWYKKIFKNDNK